MEPRLIQVGPDDAKIVVVGEAPGKREDEDGVPFVGGSGQLLDRVLGTVGLRRSQCFLTNICHTRPPGNDFEWFIKPRMRPEFALGVVQLKNDIERIKPNLVIALGAHPLRVLTNKIGIDKWRGSILESTLVAKQKVIATYHPAYCLRVYDYKAVVEMDMRRCVEEAQFPEIILPKRDIIIDPDDAIRDKLVNEMSAAEWLAVDIECFQNTDGSWRIACVGFSDRSERALVLPHDMPGNRLAIHALLTSPAKKIFQNGYAFDIPELENAGYTVTNYAWDTMLGMHSIYPECAASEDEMTVLSGRKKPQQPALRKGLAFQTSIWTKEPYYKEDRKLWQESGDLNKFWLYNGKDNCVTREILSHQIDELNEHGIMHVQDHAMSLTIPYMAMTRRGIPIDLEVHKNLRDYYEKRVTNLQTLLDQMAGGPVNVKSSSQICTLLYDKFGLPEKLNRATHRRTADKNALNELAQSNPHPALMTILEVRENRDMIERYLNAIVDDDGRMRCSFDIAGTRTGRPASRATAKGTGTNLLNQPDEIRRMFIPEPGKIIFSVDYSQAEARVVAWLARCEAMIELFLDPERDIHKENAARFYNIPIESVTFGQRYIAKRIIHASNYGMAFFRFWQVVNNDARETGIRITLNEARLGQEMYFVLYPEIKDVFWRDVRDQLKQTLVLTTILGRRREFFGRWDDKFLNEGYAYVPQGTIGDLTSKAMVKVHHELPEAELFLNGYDALIGQCAIDKVAEVTQHVQEIMAIPLMIHGRELIVPTDVEVGLNWGKRKKDKEGKIVNPKGLRSLEEWLKEAA